MTAATRLLDTLVPFVRTRLPPRVDDAYLADFLDRNRSIVVRPPEQNRVHMMAHLQAAAGRIGTYMSRHLPRRSVPGARGRLVPRSSMLRRTRR